MSDPVEANDNVSLFIPPRVMAIVEAKALVELMVLYVANGIEVDEPMLQRVLDAMDKIK